MLDLLRFYFLYPELLLLIILFIFFVFFLYKRWNKNKYFLFFWDLKKVFWSNSFSYKAYYIIIFIILFLFSIVLAWPKVSITKVDQNKNGIDIIIALDVSYSMNADDLSPNRLEVAKSVINDFLNKQISNRVWVVVFAWRPFNSLPLSFDYNIIKKIVSKIDTEIISQLNNETLIGTAIWDALFLSAKWFDDSAREKVIILLTDWEANKWIDPLLSLKFLKEKDIKAYTIWIWWLEKAYVKIPMLFWWTQITEVWWIDEETLKKIANETGGKYFRATTENSLDNIFEEIDSLEKKEISSEEVKIDLQNNIPFVFLLIFWLFIITYFRIYKSIK